MSRRNQLLEFQTHTKYLLADRLQEYLSDNVITHVDEIINNIKRVQILLSGLDSDIGDLKYIGLYSNSTAYKKMNIVNYNNARYFCLADNQGSSFAPGNMVYVTTTHYTDGEFYFRYEK